MASAVLGAAITAAACGIAVAGNDDGGPTSHRHTEQEAHQATRPRWMPPTGHRRQRRDRPESGATYEVEVTKPDGATVDVRLGDAFQLIIEGKLATRHTPP